MDRFNLQRFLSAQEQVYGTVIAELMSGRKQSHWMWFIFPQVRGLGVSPAAYRYGIRDRDEAREYLDHPVLGARLRQCTTIVNGIENRTALQIFGTPDDMKFCSSMTLFELVSDAHSVFSRAIEKYYAGRRDTLTLDMVIPCNGTS